MPAELREHDVLVLPSLAEGMPYALLEAMAIGIPVVATDVSGNVEALANGAFGRLVPRSDPQTLAEVICGCLKEPARTEAKARAALEHMRTHHDRAAAMDCTAELWQNLPGR